MSKQVPKKIILVIEDEQPLAKAIKDKLEKNSFTAATARTVEQGLRYLEDLEQVDAIWLDHYLLGREDGIDFVAKLKGHDARWKKIPIFVVSNTASSEKVDAYLRLGISKYYVKAENRLDNIIGDIKSFLEKPHE